MGFGLESIKSISGGWGAAARSCDACKSVTAAVFCRVDTAFLCITCDTRIHSFTRHERVWVCEVCEQAPAAVTCKADAAALCVTCDSDIHSANPLASRHERVPVESFFDSAVTKISATSTFGILGSSTTVDLTGSVPVMNDDLGLCPWLLPNDFNEPAKIEIGTENMKGSDFMFSDFDRLIDFEFPNSLSHHHHQHQPSGGDSIVPVQTKTEPLLLTNNNDHCFDIDFCRSKLSSFTYPTQSLSYGVVPADQSSLLSTSSLEYGVVPDGNTNNNSVSEISIPFNRSTITTSTAATTTGGDQTSSMDREARVLRYREKRKNRKFEKTIRYASRKAYAESRPRIKGRFAKRTETENDDVFLSHVYASAAAQYGVVPTF
ncbi:PREDICTED: zinc finger protein CONSTANS-LIKE 5-like [Camelina sativa]|uniref:Zinc finger protein CONSTANS-LIKE 5-like n=1 Tax=Camelina sativa TaxID=90675 RepID=A0ABM0XB15_CAMSA|nr:PREDICTED: zinc finger protein CONSTANS-LIKE 5-like [Camelina sativa]